jgi:hypothetical protein
LVDIEAWDGDIRYSLIVICGLAASKYIARTLVRQHVILEQLALVLPAWAFVATLSLYARTVTHDTFAVNATVKHLNRYIASTRLATLLAHDIAPIYTWVGLIDLDRRQRVTQFFLTNRGNPLPPRYSVGSSLFERHGFYFHFSSQK